MSVRSVWNNFRCSGEKFGLFLQIFQMYLFHICGIIWVVLSDRFMLLVYMYFADKESTRTCYTKYEVFVLSCYIAQWYYFSKCYCI